MSLDSKKDNAVNYRVNTFKNDIHFNNFDSNFIKNLSELCYACDLKVNFNTMLQ